MRAAWADKDDYDKAISYYEKALESDLKTFGPEHPDVAGDWNNLGTAWKSKGEFDKALNYHEKALRVFEKAGLLHKVKLLKDNITELEKARGEQRDAGPDD